MNLFFPVLRQVQSSFSVFSILFWKYSYLPKNVLGLHSSSKTQKMNPKNSVKIIYLLQTKMSLLSPNLSKSQEIKLELRFCSLERPLFLQFFGYWLLSDKDESV